MNAPCVEVVRSLGAYVDDELPGAERLMVSEHLEECLHCTRELESLSKIGQVLRLGAKSANVHVDHMLAGLASGVTSRIGAERSQSWGATWNRIFDDWHWVGVGLGSVAGALVTFVLASAMLVTSITQLEQMNARAGTLYVIALPQGGRGGPIMMELEGSPGTARPDIRMAMPASLGWQAERALVSALDEKLSSNGRLSSLRGLSKADRDEILALLSEIADFRYVEPARRPGGLTNVSGMHLQINTSVTAAGN
jgi:anti-sigma factor RsiW